MLWFIQWPNPSGYFKYCFWISILIIGVITLIYSFQGGMKAVIWGDVIQMIILFLGIVLCLIYGLSELGGWKLFN